MDPVDIDSKIEPILKDDIEIDEHVSDCNIVEIRAQQQNDDFVGVSILSGFDLDR